MENLISISFQYPALHRALAEIAPLLARDDKAVGLTPSSPSSRVSQLDRIGEGAVSLVERIQQTAIRGGAVRVYHRGENLIHVQMAGNAPEQHGAIEIFADVVFERADGSRYAPQRNDGELWDIAKQAQLETAGT